jgi:hypothetical protein
MTPGSPRRHIVTVGAAGKLVFQPNESYAEIGDVVEFNFLALNHTLTQSSLSDPCTDVGGFSTGFNQFNPQNVSGRFVVQYAVTTLNPQWFFCAQTKPVSHCHAGMTFALNRDSARSRSDVPSGSGWTTSQSPSATSILASVPTPPVGRVSLLGTEPAPTPTFSVATPQNNWTSATLHSVTSSVIPTGGGTRVVETRLLFLVLLGMFFTI